MNTTRDFIPTLEQAVKATNKMIENGVDIDLALESTSKLTGYDVEEIDEAYLDLISQ